MLYVRGVRLCLACVLLYTIIIYYVCVIVYIIYIIQLIFFDESFIRSYSTDTPLHHCFLLTDRNYTKYDNIYD